MIIHGCSLRVSMEKWKYFLNSRNKKQFQMNCIFDTVSFSIKYISGHFWSSKSQKVKGLRASCRKKFFWNLMSLKSFHFTIYENQINIQGLERTMISTKQGIWSLMRNSFITEKLNKSASPVRPKISMWRCCVFKKLWLLGQKIYINLRIYLD